MFCRWIDLWLLNFKISYNIEVVNCVDILKLKNWLIILFIGFLFFIFCDVVYVLFNYDF